MKMVKIKTADLIGAQLDWAVAKASGYMMADVPPDLNGENAGRVLAPPDIAASGKWAWPAKGAVSQFYFVHRASTDWNVGGPIIEREGVQITPMIDKGWAATAWGKNADGHRASATGFVYASTPLVAAMRAFVASKLGSEVEVPEVQS